MSFRTRKADAIALAIRTGVTGFGDRPASLRSEKKTIVLTQTPVGPEDRGHRTVSREVSWTANGDGTATCEQDRLMWVQAPWGMQWEGGSSFSGEPCLMPWVDAKRVFGCGVRVGLAPDFTIGLSADQIRSTEFDAGYTWGSCRVVFARYGDWRLPTLAEWQTVMGFDYKELETVLHLGYDKYYWTATERREGMLHDLPFLRSIHNCAWAANAMRWILDRQVEERLPIMFVRTA